MFCDVYVLEDKGNGVAYLTEVESRSFFLMRKRIASYEVGTRWGEFLFFKCKSCRGMDMWEAVM